MTGSVTSGKVRKADFCRERMQKAQKGEGTKSETAARRIERLGRMRPDGMNVRPIGTRGAPACSAASVVGWHSDIFFAAAIFVSLDEHENILAVS